ncbi:MAG: adenylate/guanylate cyclase domain-containing protein [Elusimicrobiota bacterium]
MRDKPVILVVDDQPQNIELIEAYLYPQGCEIIKALNGEKALEILSNHKIDLILLDVMMSGMNGYEVCRRIKKDPNNAFLPIVILTSLDNIEAKIEGLEAGADDFLNKPSHKIELIARVKNLLKMKFFHDEVELRNKLISSMLHRYVNSFAIEQIIANPGIYSKLGGDRKEVAAFFCDLRGFTSLSENMNADELIHFLNSIYKVLTGIVFTNKGTFDKYIGDCIMAFWGAPIELEEETLWSIRAAVEMQKAFKDLRQSWPPELQNLGIGIGINYGDVVVGNIGTEEAMDYTIIGDIVNTAQRVESIARPGQILITENVLLQVEGKIKIHTLEPVQLKGKLLPVKIYEVLGV